LLSAIGTAVVTSDFPRDVLDATLAADYAALVEQL
jgi:3-dehydroquinate synthase